MFIVDTIKCGQTLFLGFVRHVLTSCMSSLGIAKLLIAKPHNMGLSISHMDVLSFSIYIYCLLQQCLGDMYILSFKFTLNLDFSAGPLYTPNLVIEFMTLDRTTTLICNNNMEQLPT